MSKFVIWEICTAPKGVSIGCVGASATIVPEIPIISGVVLFLTDHILG
jgi:hypothetical protein